MVGVGIAAIAAVWVGAIAVALDLAGVLTCVAGGARRETLGLAGADLVTDASYETWVAHLDDGLDLGLSGGGESRGGSGVALRGVGTAADGIVGDLTTLNSMSARFNATESRR